MCPPPLLSGCGLISQDDGGERRTVTVWLMKDSASQDFLRRFTEEFERENPDLDLDIRIQSWTGIGDKVQTALKADGTDGPDVIEVGNTQVPQYAEGGRLRDLTLESMRDSGIRDWLPGLAEPGQWMSRQFGIPGTPPTAWSSTARTCSNRPASPSRPAPAEWLTVSEKLDSGGDQGIYLAGQDWYTLSGFIWDEGGELATQEGGTWTGALNSEAALRGMDFYRELQALGDGPLDADEEHPPQAGVFAKGQVAQIVAVPGLARSIVRENPELEGRLGFFPNARQEGRQARRGLHRRLRPRRPEEHRRTGGIALAVVEALVGTKWNTDLARTMNYVPNKKSLAKAVAAARRGSPPWRPAPRRAGRLRYAPVGRGRGGQPDQGIHDEGAHRARRGVGGPQGLRPHHRTAGPRRALTRRRVSAP